MKIAAAEQAQQADEDQIDCDDVVQKLWGNQNNDSRDERNERADAECHVHGGLWLVLYEWFRH